MSPFVVVTVLAVYEYCRYPLPEVSTCLMEHRSRLEPLGDIVGTELTIQPEVTRPAAIPTGGTNTAAALALLRWPWDSPHRAPNFNLLTPRGPGG